MSCSGSALPADHCDSPSDRPRDAAVETVLPEGSLPFAGGRSCGEAAPGCCAKIRSKRLKHSDCLKEAKRMVGICRKIPLLMNETLLINTPDFTSEKEGSDEAVRTRKLRNSVEHPARSVDENSSLRA